VTAYYNENDRFAAAWLRELIKENLIAHGEVDERSICDVAGSDLNGFTQHHFFAGIGGWSYALRLAGWPDDKPVWTGSCPCQPFSAAGKRQGEADPRHLWPDFRRLITIGNPATIFGEQVASKDGRDWFAGVRTDLEALGYAVGSADLCAASVGAPQIRQRLYWIAASSNSDRVTRLEPPCYISTPGQGWTCSEKDMQALCGSPFNDSTSWPKPLIRAMDDGIPSRVGTLRGAGNAIVPQVAAEFIKASMTCP
jgi:DNA (cytosine-5)-methyltransferase 1